MTTSTISKYIDKLAKKTSVNNHYIYRGQSQDYGGVFSTAHRRLQKSKQTEKDQYFDYHNQLIKDAKSYRYGEQLGKQLNKTELLMELQHYGAATGLIDFSEDFLVALWFACNNIDKDGEVFFLNVWQQDIKLPKRKYQQADSSSDPLFEKDEIKKESSYYLHANFKNNNRIFAQKGVFIFGYEDINPDLKSITIEKNDKQTIRDELVQYFNIEEKTLFQDIYGFAQVNNVEHKLEVKLARDYFEAAYAEEQPEAAIELYQQAIDIKPDFDLAYYNMGLSYNKLGQHEKAIRAYQQAINIEPNDSLAYCNMGVAYANLKQYKEAIEIYKEAIDIEPNDSLTYYNMGNSYYNLEQYKEAMKAYQQAIQINPKLTSHNKQQDWRALSAWVKTLDDSTFKQQCQATLRQLKGEDK